MNHQRSSHRCFIDAEFDSYRLRRRGAISVRKPVSIGKARVGDAGGGSITTTTPDNAVTGQCPLHRGCRHTKPRSKVGDGATGVERGQFMRIVEFVRSGHSDEQDR